MDKTTKATRRVSLASARESRGREQGLWWTCSPPGIHWKAQMVKLRQWLKLDPVMLTLEVGACEDLSYKVWSREPRAAWSLWTLDELFQDSTAGSRIKTGQTEITQIKERCSWIKSRGEEQKQEISERKLPYLLNMMRNNRRGSTVKLGKLNKTILFLKQKQTNKQEQM